MCYISRKSRAIISKRLVFIPSDRNVVGERLKFEIQLKVFCLLRREFDTDHY